MTQTEKAHAWLTDNGYESHLFDTELYVKIWDKSLDNPIEIHVSSAEIEYRATLWDHEEEI